MRVLFVVDQIDYEPHGIMHLSSALKAAGHEVRLAIAAYQDPVKVAQEWRPGIVGFSVITGSHRKYLELNRRIKEAVPVFSAFGGPHPTFFPEMIEADGVDGICIGEGEEALVDLANALDAGTFEPTIPNWHFKWNGEIVRNPVRRLQADLDALPPPDRALIYDADPVSRASRIKHFIAGRGCPYRCTYCFNHALLELYRGKGPFVRLRSVPSVLEEVKQVRERYGLEFVVFLDDTFILNRKWLREFTELYPRAVGLPFFCNVRANLVDEEMVQLLARAGCHSVSMGVEVGNEQVRNELLKRDMTREQILNAARLLRQAGIQFTTTNMIGLPNTTFENDLETLDLNIECKPAYAHVMIFQPYPRTALGEYTRERDLMYGSFDDFGEVAWDDSVLKFSPEHKRKLRNLQRFFAILVEWPALRPFVERFLLNLPTNWFYWLLYKLWKGYALKQRVHPVRLSLKETFLLAWHFLRIKS
jgi:anaerobic magnesium-protoporphyrin IX monomethyl ester cyclase